MGIMKRLLGRQTKLSQEDDRRQGEAEKQKKDIQRRLQLLETEVRIMRRDY